MPHVLEETAAQVEALLELAEEEREAQVEAVFHGLAVFSAEMLKRRLEKGWGLVMGEPFSISHPGNKTACIIKRVPDKFRRRFFVKKIPS